MTFVLLTGDQSLFIGRRSGALDWWRITCVEAGPAQGEGRVEVHWRERIIHPPREDARGRPIVHLASVLNQSQGRRELFVACFDGRLSLWDVSGRDEYATTADSGSATLIREYSGGQPVEQVGSLPLAIHETSRMMALLCSDGLLRIWHLDDSTPLNWRETGAHQPQSKFLAQRGLHLATDGPRSNADRIGPRSGDLLESYRFPTETVSHCFPSSSTSAVAAARIRLSWLPRDRWSLGSGTNFMHEVAPALCIGVPPTMGLMPPLASALARSGAVGGDDRRQGETPCLWIVE